MQRKYSIDFLRVMATIAVVLIHVSSAPVGNASQEVRSAIFLKTELIHILMQWSVPVFFMITGYCSMQKEKCTYDYCFSKILKYVGVLFTVGLFYALLEEFFVTKTLNVTLMANALNRVISGALWEHMWFVYSIIGIYLVLPVIYCFLQQEINNVCILTVLLFLFNILFPAISKYIMIGFELPFEGYLFYVCFGAMIAKIKIDKKWIGLSYLVVVLSVMYMFVNVGKQAFIFKHPVVCFMAMGIFVVISSKNIKYNKFIDGIAKCSWGIYLIHPFFMNVAIKLLKIDVLSGNFYFKLLIFAVVLFVLSYATTYILKKIPIVNKLF